MQFSESWLRTFVNPSLSSEELSHLLTMAGLEVEEMTSVAPAFDKVVVGQVLTKDKHPDADRLNVLTVDVGQAEPLNIVCGARNVTVGMKAPCALVGAKLPGIEIKQAKVRGIASFGMMCSEKELGLAEESAGLMVLAADAIVGQSIREHLDLDDHLITLKLTPNRSDCLSLNGIAREVAALTGAPLQAIPQASLQTGWQARARKVKVTASAACPRYTGRVISGVNAKAATPAWMVQRLERCGLRSISALVDVTNYVLLELGQPLHAFDLNKLNGDIEVRFARAGESLKLLNEQTVNLQDDMLVIADGKGPVALAGVMGGADSAVDDATTDIFLESAFFAPGVIVGKSRRLGFSSDSSYRFERGVDFAATQAALDRATQLILDICGGQAGAVTEVQGELPARHPVKLRTSRVHRVLGVALEADEIAQILSRLGMVFQQKGDEFSRNAAQLSLRYRHRRRPDRRSRARVRLRKYPAGTDPGAHEHIAASRGTAPVGEAAPDHGVARLSGNHQLRLRGSRMGARSVWQYRAHRPEKPHRQPDERDAQQLAGRVARCLAYQSGAQTASRALVRDRRLFCRRSRQLCTK